MSYRYISHHVNGILSRQNRFPTSYYPFSDKISNNIPTTCTVAHPCRAGTTKQMYKETKDKTRQNTRVGQTAPVRSGKPSHAKTMTDI